jgi:hypothetical protein
MCCIFASLVLALGNARLAVLRFSCTCAEFRTIGCASNRHANFNLVKFENQSEQDCMEVKLAPRASDSLSHGMIAGAVAQILYEVESAKFTFIYIYSVWHEGSRPLARPAKYFNRMELRALNYIRRLSKRCSRRDPVPG